MDALTELLEYRKPHGLSPLGKRFQLFHQFNPDVLDFFIQELVTLRENGWRRTSFGSLWHHARWVLSTLRRAPGETFAMSQNLACHYARAIIILHPEINGFFVVEKAQADGDFGVRVEPASRNPQRGYVRKLQWADGTAIQDGWRPSSAHVITTSPIPRRPPVRRAVKAMRRVG
ncbi:MAG: hypothetical protein WA172_19260 [Terriglobales bacterium]|jgi:hypothetical protein